MAKLTKFQEIAKTNITECFNYEVGGWYNCVQDGCEEHIPDTRDEAEAFIYDAAITNLYKPGYCGANKAPGQMRFAGKEFMIDFIHELFDGDNEIVEIAEAKHWDDDAHKRRPNKLHNRNKLIECNGESHTLTEWSEILGIGLTTLHGRLYKLHWPIERVFAAKKSRNKEVA